MCIARSTFTFSLRTESAVKSIGGSIAVIATSCSMWFWKMSRIAPASFVVPGATSDAHGLGDRDLDMVDELPVPDRLEDPVREAERHHVLHGLLAEVVVDAEDLALVEVLLDHLLQLARGREIVAERLLDDQPHPTLRRAALADRLTTVSKTFGGVAR